MTAAVTAFCDEATNAPTCLVRDFDHASGRSDTRAADAVVAAIQRDGLDLRWGLETHIHADHLSAICCSWPMTMGNLSAGANKPALNHPKHQTERTAR
ncbi:MAG: hypothetical protein U1D35_17205 [Paracoccaceae bacterium]|nr:hypothetical protein [Paracoccaceae bacterium]